MKRLIRALVGILATVVIVILIERTMISFEFFPKEAETMADSTAMIEAEQDSLAEEAKKNAFNPVIKAKDFVNISDSKTIEANKIYKKEVSFHDDYITNLVFKDTIPNYSDDMTVSFEFEHDDFYENVLFIVLDCLDSKTSTLVKRFYEPVEGINRLKIKKEKLSDGWQTFRVGYFLRKEASKSRVIFYNKELKVFIEE